MIIKCELTLTNVVTITYLSASCKIALNDIDIAGLHPLRVDYDNKINVTNCKRITSVVNFLIMHLRVF